MEATPETSVVDAARQAMGPVGVSLPVSFASMPHADLQREAVGRLEQAGGLGYSARDITEVSAPHRDWRYSGG